MAEILTGYLEASTSLQWQWGLNDCALWMADYVKAVRGGDPGAGFRGRYKTEFGCGLFLARRGGLLSVVSKAAIECGLQQVDTPTRGDIGVVEFNVIYLKKMRLERAAAIFLGNNWSIFSPKGLLIKQAMLLQAWSV